MTPDDAERVTIAHDPPALTARVTIHTLDGNRVRIGRMEGANVMALVDDVSDPDADGITLTLDADQRSIVLIPRDSIARVDIDWRVPWAVRAWDRVLDLRDRWS